MYLQFFIFPGSVHAAEPVGTFPCLSVHWSESFWTSLSQNLRIPLNLLSSSSHDSASNTSSMREILISCISDCINILICDVSKVHAYFHPVVKDASELLLVWKGKCDLTLRLNIPRLFLFLCNNLLSCLHILIITWALLFLHFLCCHLHYLLILRRDNNLMSSGNTLFFRDHCFIYFHFLVSLLLVLNLYFLSHDRLHMHFRSLLFLLLLMLYRDIFRWCDDLTLNFYLPLFRFNLSMLFLRWLWLQDNLGRRFLCWSYLSYDMRPFFFSWPFATLLTTHHFATYYIWFACLHYRLMFKLRLELKLTGEDSRISFRIGKVTC